MPGLATQIRDILEAVGPDVSGGFKTIVDLFGQRYEMLFLTCIVTSCRTKSRRPSTTGR